MAVQLDPSFGHTCFWCGYFAKRHGQRGRLLGPAEIYEFPMHERRTGNTSVGERWALPANHAPGVGGVVWCFVNAANLPREFDEAQAKTAKDSPFEAFEAVALRQRGSGGCPAWTEYQEGFHPSWHLEQGQRLELEQRRQEHEDRISVLTAAVVEEQRKLAESLQAAHEANLETALIHKGISEDILRTNDQLNKITKESGEEVKANNRRFYAVALAGLVLALVSALSIAFPDGIPGIRFGERDTLGERAPVTPTQSTHGR